MSPPFVPATTAVRDVRGAVWAVVVASRDVGEMRGTCGQGGQDLRRVGSGRRGRLCAPLRYVGAMIFPG